MALIFFTISNSNIRITYCYFHKVRKTCFYEKQIPNFHEFFNQLDCPDEKPKQKTQTQIQTQNKNQTQTITNKQTLDKKIRRFSEFIFSWKQNVHCGRVLHSDWYYKLIYLDILSAKYPMSIPEIVKTTTKVGPAKTWYFMPWPFSRLWRSK